jgi:hypothetical protein
MKVLLGTELPLQMAHALENGETEAYRKNIRKTSPRNLFKVD